MADEWGSGGEVEPEGEHVPSSIALGGGLVLRIDQRRFRRMMNSAPVKRQVDARGRAVAAEANSQAITKGAVYEYVPSENPDNTRARGRVRPANYKAVVDDAHHSTLIKALASVGSDPKPEHHEGAEHLETME